MCWILWHFQHLHPNDVFGWEILIQCHKDASKRIDMCARCYSTDTHNYRSQNVWSFLKDSCVNIVKRPWLHYKMSNKSNPMTTRPSFRQCNCFEGCKYFTLFTFFKWIRAFYYRNLSIYCNRHWYLCKLKELCWQAAN